MRIKFTLIIIIVIAALMSCKTNPKEMNTDKKTVNVVFLHHSTGKTIWRGGNTFVQKVKLKLGFASAVDKWFANYNKVNQTDYKIEAKPFPSRESYGWKNYPYDYYNIWVKNGDKPYYKDEPTLMTLSEKYDVIVLKHCFPVSKLSAGEMGVIDSDEKTIENYKAQYQALYATFQQYPKTKFIIWTPPALTKRKSKEKWALNMREFYMWMKEEWDKPNDNVYLWDFRALETEGGLYLKDAYAESESDSHPNTLFAQKAYPNFCERIVEVIQN